MDYPRSKRNRLVGKYHFGGVYQKPEELWTEVNEYIEACYDTEYLEKIYILGDGASWIKVGTRVLGSKCKFVLDGFHMNKYIKKAIGHLGDAIGKTRDAIYDAIRMEEKETLNKIFDFAIESATEKSKQMSIFEAKRYVMNQWDGIIIKNNDEDARMGSSAEGQISHIFAARLSSRPIGWSKVGADKMARLRVYKANGGKVIDLLKYKKSKEERQITEEARNKTDQAIRKKCQRFTDAWEHQIETISTGKRTTMYKLFQQVRGIPG